MEIEKPGINDILSFAARINMGNPLTEEQQKGLFEAFMGNLPPEDRKKAENILEIVKAFS